MVDEGFAKFCALTPMAVYLVRSAYDSHTKLILAVDEFVNPFLHAKDGRINDPICKARRCP